MGTQIPYDIIGTKREEKKQTWIEGVHHVKVEQATEAFFRDGRKQFVVRERVIAPEHSQGQSIFTTYWIGTKDDANADKNETWASNFGAVKWKEFVNSFNFEPDPDFEIVAAQLKDQEYLPYVEPETYQKKNPDGTFAVDDKGQPVMVSKGKVTRCYKLGSRPIGSTNGEAKEPAKPVLRSVPKPPVEVAPGFVVEEAE